MRVQWAHNGCHLVPLPRSHSSAEHLTPTVLPCLHPPAESTGVQGYHPLIEVQSSNVFVMILFLPKGKFLWKNHHYESWQ